ncbi:cyclophilin-like fold protein [Mucilaginibacter lappiensis]|uniref:Cyclophilin-like domain-containing protein n=1 Tax=Mucilaginibacter lappiensis TaxID=354630 RepID=A0A841JJ07_9SPHI|nr:cyclophilin-like fold protein [Mucilaginibacter lappiensis]MBB6131153.1 hypothetical protein [Mucilaginibacter lappiensis]
MKSFNRKYSSLLLLIITSALIFTSFSCAKEKNEEAVTSSDTLTSHKMIIKVNSQTFTATLLDNKTTQAFKQLLPMTIHMTELNGNEKYFDLSQSLPTEASNPGNIKNGDIMLYGSKSLVLFYKTFQTSYDYTKVGTVNNVEDYAAALSTGNVTVALEMD